MKQPRFASLPFKLGTTSYILEDDILPNVRFLSDQVDDIELVLFEVDELNNLPAPSLVRELRAIADDHAMGYTVHFPLDLAFDQADTADKAVNKLISVIDATRALEPNAWVLHLDSHHTPPEMEKTELQRWTTNAIAVLKRVTAKIADPKRVTVENLESYPPEWNHPVIAAARVSECIDIGHLNLRQRDPIAYLNDRLAFARVIHWHGIGTRDHQSLTNCSQREVTAILRLLKEKDYKHTVTLEVFSRPDFETSLDWIEGALSA